jgi:DNA-directed RNA polymerase subunit alpha
LIVNSLGIIPTDSNFSPVLNVAYNVEEIKVSQSESHEQLNISVTTNGSISPTDALNLSAKILIGHLLFLTELSNTKEPVFANDNYSEKTASVAKNVSIPLEDLELSVRASNSLKREGIRNVSQLVSMTLGDLKSIDNLGSKSIREIKTALGKFGLSFKKANSEE